MTAEDILCLLQCGAHGGCDQVVLGHDLLDAHVKVGEKAHVAVCDDAHQSAVIVAHRYAGNAIFAHQIVGFVYVIILFQKEWIGDDAVLVSLDALHLIRLPLDGHVLMDHACAALARHRDRHVALGDRVHGGAHERNMEADFFCKLCVQADLLRYHIALAGDQQDIVECKTLLCEFFRRILIDHITTSLRAAHIFFIIAHTAMACQECI